MCQANFLAMTMMANLRLSSVSMSTSMEITFDCSFCIRLLLLGSEGGASLSEASPDSMDCWNWYTKLGPFFSASSFNHNFQPNDNQTFIVYAKVHEYYTERAYAVFTQFWDSPWKKSYVEQSVATISDQRE